MRLGKKSKDSLEVEKARRMNQRGFISAFLPLKQGGIMSLDPNSILMGNVQNKLYDMTPYLEQIGENWTIEKKIAHIEGVTSTPLMSQADYTLLSADRSALKVIESSARVMHESRWWGVQGSEQNDESEEVPYILGGTRGRQSVDEKLDLISRYGLRLRFYVDGSDPSMLEVPSGHSLHVSIGPGVEGVYDAFDHRTREVGYVMVGDKRYSVLKNTTKLLDELKRSLESKRGSGGRSISGAPKIIVWIQGTILRLSDGRSLNPRQTVDALQQDLSPNVASVVDEWFANSWTGSSPQHMLRDVLAGKRVPSVFWSKQVREKHSGYTKAWKALEDTYPGHLNPLFQYIYGEGPGARTYEDLLSDLTKWLLERRRPTRDVLKHSMEGDREHVLAWWKQPIMANVRWYVSKLQPRKLNVQVCRQFNHGLAYVQGFPQVFPTSSLTTHDPSLLDEMSVDYNQRYYNYDPYVTMTQDVDLDSYDLHWTPHPEGGWRLVHHRESTVNASERFVIEDDMYCMGWGSVVVAWHSALGVGASVPDTLIRERIKGKYASQGKKVDVSGHIIHSLLSHDAHFLWGLEELWINLTSKQSIYVPIFDEQRKGAYHTITDYHAGLDAAAEFQLPTYAFERISVCRSVLNAIEKVAGNT
jgi:hypothetical protein